ncbi:MAG: leucine-rich repeat domain-containing protein [Bacteroidota bacterium]
MIRILLFAICFWGGFLPTDIMAQDADSVVDTSKVVLKVYRSYGEGLRNPDSVFVLDLSKQKRKVLPDEVRQFRTLQELRISRNSLSTLPDWIGELTQLKKLDVSNNKLTSLPASIGLLNKLEFLGLNRNLIRELPVEIGGLSSLQILEMWDNELEVVPDELKKLHALKVFELRGILFSQRDQERIRSLVPDADVYFSPPCNCKN